MKFVRQCIVSLILTVMGAAIWLSPLLTYGASDPVITFVNPGGDESRIEKACEQINEELAESKVMKGGFLSYEETGDALNVSFDMQDYRDLGQDKRQECMDIVLTCIYNSDISRSNRNKFYNEVCALDETTSSLARQLSHDVRADFAGAYSTFKPFSGVLGWILGLITLAMFVTLGLSIVVDLAFINLPIIQLALVKQVDQKPKLISLEAWAAVKESESKAGHEYVSPNWYFIKHKSKQYIIVFMCMLYLTSGKIYDVLANIMDYFRGFLPK